PSRLQAEPLSLRRFPSLAAARISSSTPGFRPRSSPVWRSRYSSSRLSHASLRTTNAGTPTRNALGVNIGAQSAGRSRDKRTTIGQPGYLVSRACAIVPAFLPACTPFLPRGRVNEHRFHPRRVPPAEAQNPVGRTGLFRSPSRGGAGRHPALHLLPRRDRSRTGTVCILSRRDATVADDRLSPAIRTRDFRDLAGRALCAPVFRRRYVRRVGAQVVVATPPAPPVQRHRA